MNTIMVDIHWTPSRPPQTRARHPSNIPESSPSTYNQNLQYVHTHTNPRARQGCPTPNPQCQNLPCCLSPYWTPPPALTHAQFASRRHHTSTGRLLQPTQDSRAIPTRDSPPPLPSPRNKPRARFSSVVVVLTNIVAGGQAALSSHTQASSGGGSRHTQTNPAHTTRARTNATIFALHNNTLSSSHTQSLSRPLRQCTIRRHLQASLSTTPTALTPPTPSLTHATHVPPYTRFPNTPTNLCARARNWLYTHARTR